MEQKLSSRYEQTRFHTRHLFNQTKVWVRFRQRFMEELGAPEARNTKAKERSCDCATLGNPRRVFQVATRATRSII